MQTKKGAVKCCRNIIRNRLNKRLNNPTAEITRWTPHALTRAHERRTGVTIERLTKDCEKTLNQFPGLILRTPCRAACRFEVMGSYGRYIVNSNFSAVITFIPYDRGTKHYL